MSKEKIYPSKKTMNLCKKEKPLINIWAALLGIIVIAVLAAVFSKFAVMNRLDKVSAAEAEVSTAKALKEKYEDALKDYDAVLAEYEKYSVSWMSENEKNLVSRSSMLDVVEDELLGFATVNSVSVSGNQISVQLKDTNLSDISILVDNLNKRDDVNKVSVNNVSTNEKGTSVSVVITMQSEGGDAK